MERKILGGIGAENSKHSLHAFIEQITQSYGFEEQFALIEQFFQDFAKSQSCIWLKNLTKTSPPEAVQFPIPFNLEDKQIQDPIEKTGHYTTCIGEECWLVFPLQAVESRFGELILKRDLPFSQSEVNEFKDISSLISMALYTTHLQDVQIWRKKQLDLVKSVTEKISQITNLQLLNEQVTSLVQDTFKYAYVAVFLIHEETGRLHFQASSVRTKGLSDSIKKPEFESPAHPGFELGEHIIGHVAATGKALVANDISKEPRYKKVDSLADTQSEVVLPLKIENQILGVFDVQSNQKNAFDENDLLVLQALADNVAIAIYSTQLYQRAKIRADQLNTVSEVSRALTLILDIDELIETIVSLIHDRFGYPYVHLYTVDPIEQKITFKAGSGLRKQKYLEEGIAFPLNSDKGIVAWVARHGQTRRINNVKDDPLYLPSIDPGSPSKSELAIPLSFGGVVLGVLDIQNDRLNAFSQDDQQLMETLADNIAIALRNARLYRSEGWRRQIAESLRDVAGLLSDNTDLSEILYEILRQLRKNLPSDIAGIWMFDPETQDEPLETRRLYLAAHDTSENYPVKDSRELTFTPDAWVRNALEKSYPTIREPHESRGPIARRYNLPQEYSSIAAPLFTGDEVLGMLTLDHHTQGRYGAESQKITSAFASYAAIAIKNTRLYTQSQEQARISTILLEVATATQSFTNLLDLSNTIVQITPMVVGVKGCALFMREPNTQIFSLFSCFGISDSPEVSQLEAPIIIKNAPIFEKLLSSPKPLRIEDPDFEFNLAENSILRPAGENLTLLPLIARDEILGAFLIADEETKPASLSKRSSHFDEERDKIIQGIMQQTAVAVENIRLLEARQEEAYISTVLLQSAQAAVSSEDLDDTLNSIVHIMPLLVGIDASVIYLWNSNEKQYVATQASLNGNISEEQLLGSTFVPGEFPMLDTILKNNRPIAHPFVDHILPPDDWDLVLPDEDQTDPTPVLQSPYPLLMGFPLSMMDTCFGVLLCQDKQFTTNRERRFELLVGMAQQASLAIQNDIIKKEMIEREHLEREFKLARQIQQTFLPDQKPELDGWGLAVHWETARQVGGDFYDYFLLPDGRLALVIADVSDKGLAASLYMSVTRTLIRAVALESTSPSNTLERVNQLLMLNSQEGLFITAVYGILSLKDGILNYTIAGHNPPLVLRSDDSDVIELDMGGVALGAMPDIHLDERQMTINPGDCIMFYTDGLTEAFDLEDQMYGEERLIKVFKRCIGMSASEVINIVNSDLKTFRGHAPLSDDTTILTLCRLPSLTNDNRDA